MTQYSQDTMWRSDVLHVVFSVFLLIAPHPRVGGVGSMRPKRDQKNKKITKYCPNPIIIINKVVEDVPPRSVRHVSEYVSDDLL